MHINKGIYIISDLHLEFLQGKMPKILTTKESGTNMIALLGDTCSLTELSLLISFIKYIKDLGYTKIFYVFGNHEYYDITSNSKIMTMSIAKANAIEIKKIIEDKYNIEFIILDNSLIEFNKHYDIPNTDIRIIGMTMWCMSNDPLSQFQISQRLNDYRHIYLTDSGETLKTYDTIHLRDKAQYDLSMEIANAKINNKRCIILTHMAPHIKCIDIKRYKESKINDAYYIDCTEFLMQSHIIAWGYGHNHLSFDQMIEGTRVCSNPFGYKGDAKGKDIVISF